MVKINYCPSCGAKLQKGSFICPTCQLDIEELFAKGYLLMSDSESNSIELFDDANISDKEVIMKEIEPVGDDVLDKPNINFKSGDEIVIVVPEDADTDELVIDLDELGIDIENLDDDVNIVIQVEGEMDDELFDDEDEDIEPNEWYFDDDPYDIVYYEFVSEDEDEL